MGYETKEQRKPGLIFESGYWHTQSLVKEIDTYPNGMAYRVVEIDPDGRERVHCTPWDKGDKIVTPIHEHDCTNCVFLGTQDNHDLYFCPTGGGGSVTVLARSGPDGDYESGMVFATNGTSPLLAEALKRARAWGVYDG